MSKRIIYGFAMIVILAGLLVLEGWLSSRDYFILTEWFRGIDFAGLVALILAGAAVEYLRMARAKGVNAELWVIILAVTALTTIPYWFSGVPGAEHLAMVLFGCLLLGALVQGIKTGTNETLSTLSVTVFGIIYLGLGGFFLVSIRLLGRESSDTWGQIGPVVMFLSCVKSTDIGAYFTGRLIGRHKLVPSISPGKTWEGLLGGVALSVIVASLFASYSGIMYNSRAIAFGCLVAVSGQMGDLLESMLKRDAGVKDSANLLPEFGGVLDLLDSPLVAAPFAYILFVC